MKTRFQLPFRIAITAVVILLSAERLSAQNTATATGSGTWDPQTQTGTASWSGGSGTGGRPASGESITISNGVNVTLTGHGNGTYLNFDNQSGSPNGFNLGGYSIAFYGNVSGGCTGGTGSQFFLNGGNQNFSGTYTADTVFFTGSQSKTFVQNSTIYGNVKTNSGTGIRGNGTTLDVYGSIVNNGSIYINFSTDTLRVWGNLINNGSNWGISNTKIKSRSTLSGSSTFSTRILVDTSCYIDGNISIYRLEIRSGDTLYIPDVSDALTVTGGGDEAKIFGTIYGSGSVNFGGHVTSANTNLSTIVFNGGNQNVNGQFTAGQIIFGGSNSKTISNYAALYGNTSVNSGSSLQCLGTVLDVYGNFLNNGSLAVNYSTDSIRIWGNVTNNGSWNISNTKIKNRATITGTNEYYTRFWLDTTCTIDGNVSIRQLEIPAGDTLYIPDASDGLNVVYSVNSTINGAIYGAGTVAFQGNVTSASTTASSISFTGSSQTIGGFYTADQITFSGASKYFNNISLFGNTVINSGVNLYGLGATMNVFGAVLNNGSITNNYSTDSIRVWGNMTNNGNWTIANTKIKAVAAISGAAVYNTKFYIDTNCYVSGKAQIQHLQIIAGKTVNISTASDTLVVAGNAVSESGGQTAGNGLLIFGGGSQTFSGVYGAANILFSGSGTKSFQNASLYGNTAVNNGILLQGNGTTLNVYGSMTNNGTLVNNYSTDSIRIWGDVSNYNAWNIAHTKIKSIATVTGSSLYNTRFWADTNCYIHGKLRVLRLEVPAGDTVFLPEGTDTLVTTGDGTTISGWVYGNGIVYYNAGVTSSQTAVSELFFSGGSQAIDGAFTAQQITFGGSGTKSLGHTSLYGNANILAAVTVVCTGTVLNMFGPLTNNGSLTNNYSTDTLRAYGDLTNNGTWTINNTVIKTPLVLSGISLFNTNMRMDSNCYVDGKVQIQNLTVTAGDTVKIPDVTDTLAVTNTFTVQAGGYTEGSGALLFSGGTQTLSGKFSAATILFGGSGYKYFTAGNHSIYGNALVLSGSGMGGNGSTINLYGSINNNGTIINNYSTDTIKISNHAYNNGTWNIANTVLVDTGKTAGNFSNTGQKFYILADRRLDGNWALSGNVYLNGIITTNHTDTFMVNTTSFNRISGYVNGNLRMPVTTGSPVTEFHLGNTHGYTPVTVNFTNVTTGGNMTVSLKTGAHPLVAYPDSALTRYWKFGKDANLAFAAYSPTLRYLSADFNAGITEPGDEAMMVAGFRAPTRWIFPTITQRAPGGTNDGGSLVIGNLSDLSDIVIGKDTNIFNANMPPQIVSPITDQVLDEDFGTAFVADLHDVFTEPDGAPMTFSYSLLVMGINVSIVNDSVFIHSIPDQHGIATIEVRASDGYNLTRDTFTVTVTPVNDAPMAFNLLEPQNGDTLDFYQPMVPFTWNASQDVDGDTLVYGLYIREYTPQEDVHDTLIPGITDTLITVNMAGFWGMNKHYKWIVVAYDGQVFTAASDTFAFYTEGGLDVSENPQALPKTFALKQNYPNPFNPVTTIPYQLPEKARVTLRVYNILGQEVRTLVQTVQLPGYYRAFWDGKNKYGNAMPSGVYLYRLEAGRYSKTYRMLLIK